MRERQGEYRREERETIVHSIFDREQDRDSELQVWREGERKSKRLGERRRKRD